MTSAETREFLDAELREAGFTLQSSKDVDNTDLYTQLVYKKREIRIMAVLAKDDVAGPVSDLALWHMIVPSSGGGLVGER